MKKYIKSPMNYIGGKYRLLTQILKYFPSEINTFIDLFAGGLDVSINISANKILCNDINNYLIDIYKSFQSLSIQELLEYIDNQISKYNLSKTNKDAYINFRNYYNKTKNPLDLYILICYSFNHQLRFNSNHEYNNPFGANKSSFNSNIRNNLIEFHKKIQKFYFLKNNFKEYDISKFNEKDFIYADPPYLISCGSYNDGKRGFEGWTQEEDFLLFELLDRLHQQGCKFALSNVVEHKGNKNEYLAKWMKKYTVHNIEYNYNNSNYQAKNKNNITQEILVTNY